MPADVSAPAVRALKTENTKTLTYKTVNGINLPVKLYFPKDHKPEDRRAAIVCIHGGAWRAVKDNSEWDGGLMAPQAGYYASVGAIGITISYRDFPPPETNTGGVSLSDLFDDCRDAIRYIRKNAAVFGIDTRRIAVIGDSAGGHLAGCLAVIGNDDEDGKVNAAVLCNPITDLTDPAWIKYVSCTHGGDPVPAAKAISPLHCLGSGCVPVLLMHGMSDSCVSTAHSELFYKKSTELGNLCRLRLFPETKHAFIIFGYTASDEQLENAMNTANEFLVDTGFLK